MSTLEPSSLSLTFFFANSNEISSTSRVVDRIQAGAITGGKRVTAPVAMILQEGSTAQTRRGYIAEAPVPLCVER